MDNFEAQLKQTCRLTSARWAVWLDRTEAGLNFGPRHALNKARENSLKKFINEGQRTSWLAGAFSGGRMRQCQSGNFSGPLGCVQVYVFPHPEGKQAILVGADSLTSEARSFWRILALIHWQGSC